MKLRKYRWSKHYESAEEELIALLAAKRIIAEPWTAEEMQVFDPIAEAQDKTMWCAEGSMILTIEGKRISLQPGDVLEIPAQTTYRATAGISGCVLLVHTNQQDN